MRLAVALLALIIGAAPMPAAQPSEPLDLIAPVDGPIVRHFEPPPTPFSAGHRGIDFRTPSGEPVVASAGGTVAFAGPVGGTYAVSIDHIDGHRTTYSYLSGVAVRAGTVVTQGALIGSSGAGHAGGEPVLHFGLRRAGEYLDPEPVLLASIRAHLYRVIALTW